MFTFLPWLVWLSGLSTSLPTRGSRVPFLVGAHAWVVGWVSGWGSTHPSFTPSLSLSLPFSLKINK